MPDDGKRTRLFLCHASEDKSCVRDVYEKLKAEGFDPWLDKEDLLPGQLWREEIPRAIHSAACALVFLSTTSVSKRGYIQKEFKLALDTLDEIPEGEIFLIPIRIDDCEIPNRIAKIHCCDLFEKDGFERIVRAIRMTIDSDSRTGTATVDSADRVPNEVVLPISGGYRLREERWEPDGSLWQEINEEAPGAVLSIKMESRCSGRYQLDSSVGKQLGRVSIDDDVTAIGTENDPTEIGTVVSVNESRLVTLRLEEGMDDESFQVTSTWDRLSVIPAADFKPAEGYTLFVRKLICLESMCEADLVTLLLGPVHKWTGEIRSGYEVPLGIEEEFTNAETIQLHVWEPGSAPSQGGTAYLSEELTVSRRKAGQGEQVLQLVPESGDRGLFDYEVVYEVV